MPLQQPFSAVVYRELWPLARARRNACAAAHLLCPVLLYSCSKAPFCPGAIMYDLERPEFAAASMAQMARDEDGERTSL